MPFKARKGPQSCAAIMSSCFNDVAPFDKDDDAADNICLQGVQGWRGLGVSRPEPSSACLPPGGVASPLKSNFYHRHIYLSEVFDN